MKKRTALLVLAGAYLAYDYLAGDPTDPPLVGPYIDALAIFNGNAMITSTAGKQAIVAREGNVNTVYADSAGNLTAGVGHLLTSLDKLSWALGDTVSDGQISAWFTRDLTHAENIVNHYVNVVLNQNQFDALVSATFNLGTTLFASNGAPSGFLLALNSGDFATAMTHLSWYDQSGGIVVAGLETRRESEVAQFNS